MAGFSLWGCSDEEAGPGVGPDTSWQVGCSGTGSGCGSSLNAHGPVDGADLEVDYDDTKLKVSCSKSAAGFKISIEDPGRNEADSEDPNMRKWARSVLEITNAKPDTNECFVRVTEYALTGTRFRLNEVCAGNEQTSLEGECELTGEEDSDGYAFNGTLRCPGMHDGNTIPRPYKLGAARDFDEPMKLQIKSCK